MVDDDETEEIVLATVILRQSEQLAAQHDALAASHDKLMRLLGERIANGGGGGAPEKDPLEEIEKSLGGLVFRRPDLDPDQWLKLDAARSPADTADRDIRIEPWRYVPMTDPDAIAETARLLEERRQRAEEVKDLQKRERAARAAGN